MLWFFQMKLGQRVLNFGQQSVDFWNLHKKLNKSTCSLHIGSDENIFGFSINDHFIFRKNLNFGQYEMHPSPRSIFYEDFAFQQLVDQWSTIVDQIRCQSTMEHFFETLHQKFMNKTDHAFFNSNCKIILYTNPQKYIWSFQSRLGQQVLPFGQQKVDF